MEHMQCFSYVRVKKIALKQVLLVIYLLLFSATTNALVRYVTPEGNGEKNGSSWNNASDDIQEMINISTSGDSIWVASGTYLPTHSAANWTEEAPTAVNVNPMDQHNAFVLKTGVKVYGGFSGNETSFSQRNWIGHRTILSGDFSGNDHGNDSSHPYSAENAYHIVISVNNGQGTVLDGFTIWGGNYYGDHLNIPNINSLVNGEDVPHYYGGGIYANKSAALLCNLEIRRNAASAGGGIFCINSSELRGYNLYIFKNFASNGGGMLVADSPKFKNIIVMANEAGIGAGICNSWSSSGSGTSPHYINMLLHSNLGSPTNGYGAGMQNEGAAPTITNSTIVGNFGGAENGAAGILNYIYSNPVINNSIIWNNTIAEGLERIPKNIESYYEAPWTNSVTFNNSLVQGMDLTATGGLDATAPGFDPMFISPPDYAHLDLFGFESRPAGSFTLNMNSPCIDMGDNDLYKAACGDDFLGWENELALTPPPYTPAYEMFNDFFGAYYPTDAYSGKEALRLGGNNVNIGAFEATFVPASILLNDWIYDETPSVPNIIGNPDNTTIAYYYSTSPETSSFTNTTMPVDAGVYYVQGKIESTNNSYETIRTSPVKFSINKKVIDINDPEENQESLKQHYLEYNLSSSVYTKLPQSVQIKAAENITGLGEITVKYDDNVIAPQNAGTYAVSIDVAEGLNYAKIEDWALGDYNIQKAPQSINFDPKTELFIKDGSYPLTATATSEFPVSFMVNDDYFAQIEGNILIPKQPGTIEVTAYVSPSGNYEDAEEVTVSITLKDTSTGTIEIIKNQNNIQVFPNPKEKGTVLNISLPEEAQNAPIKIYDMKGVVVKQLTLPNDAKTIEVPLQIPAGNYILKWKEYEVKLIVN